MPRSLGLKGRALSYLARREHSRLELERKLASHAQSPQELSSLLDRLEQTGLLSPARLVEQLVQTRKARFGSVRIAHELREKGIAENLISSALTNMMETEQQSAREVWRKKFGMIPANSKELGRQTRFLIGRGFSPEVVRRILRCSDEEDA